MANIAAKRIKREFREVLKSDEIFLSDDSSLSSSGSISEEEIKERSSSPSATRHETKLGKRKFSDSERQRKHEERQRKNEIRREKSKQVVGGSIKLELVDNSWTNLQGEITGPVDTPYEGGRFALEIKVPDTYPFNPPKIRFITKIWHPNVSSVTGAICLDILKDQWAAALTLRTVLLSIQALMSAAEPDDPQDAVVAKQYKEDNHMYHMTARHWTNVYAGGPEVIREFNAKVQRLSDMGIDEHQARVALSSFNWHIESATENLFS